MHTKTFKLEISMLAIGDVDCDGKREVLSIPAGEMRFGALIATVNTFIPKAA